MKAPPNHIAQFLDVEAEVTDDDEREATDDEAENDLMIQFLDDETVASDDETHMADTRNDEDDNEKNAFWNGILDRARLRGRPEEDQGEGNYIEKVLPFVTKPDDYPLWKIACRVGLEYTAMQSLFTTASDRHQVRSIVVRDSIQGYIYLEATMNAELVKLLCITPGIISSQGRLKKSGIPCSEFADLFRMDDKSQRFHKGVWVNIQHGLYQGDVGLVLGMKDWCVEVLVVPRLTKGSQNAQKRKRSTAIPPPNLFDPSQFPEKKVIQTDENSYKIGSVHIEHGLCKKGYDFKALDPNIETITFPMFKMFRRSRHPAVLDIDIPRPEEWKFEVNDRVEVLSSGRIGRVTVVHSLYLEVNRDLDEITQSWCFVHDDHERVRWYNIQKLFNVGDYVKVTGGPYTGDCGWVVRVEKTKAALDLAGEKRRGEGAPYKIEEIIVPINCLCSTLVPHAAAGLGPSGNPHVGREMKNPWIGRDVLITKDGHPSKGSIGTVKEVVRADVEGKSLRLMVEFGDVIRPGLPFERIWISSEDVREFHPSETESPKYYPLPGPSTSQVEQSPVTSSEPQHVLLQPCFEGLEVKAMVKGGVFELQKERLVQIVEIDKRLLLRTNNQRTVVTLDPSWVELIHPKARADNNLLIFVTGQHIGKFSRRIHHRDDSSGPVSIFVAIVERHANMGDSLSPNVEEHEIEAPMAHFAIVSETKAEKLNKNQLMDDLRKRWRGKD